MNIDLNKLDKIVISHGHDDHTRGLMYLLKDKTTIELMAHPKCFNYKEVSGEYIGSPMTKDELEKVCKLTLSKKPIIISKNIIFLGEIPQLVDFEKRKYIGKYKKDNMLVDDAILDDSAIVYKSSKGLFIITGCSHSGICNIIEYAKKVCNDTRIYGVLGGFHLFDVDERLEKTINHFKKNMIELLYPCHCVSLKAKSEMAKKLKINEVGVGLEMNI